MMEKEDRDEGHSATLTETDRMREQDVEESNNGSSGRSKRRRRRRRSGTVCLE